MKKGFSLIHLVVYMALFSLFSLQVMHFFSQTVTGLVSSRNRFSRQLKNALVLDVIRRDIMSASMRASDWHEQAFVFRKHMLDKKSKRQQSDVGFYLKKGRAVRIQGQYDYAAQRWIKRFTSLVGGRFESMACRIKLDARYKTVLQAVVTYREGSVMVEKEEAVRLRNRILS